MATIVTEKMRVANAYSFIRNIGDDVGENTLYVGVGKTDPWSGNEGDPGFILPSPLDDDEYKARVWDDLIALKKIEKFDVRPVIPRVDWGDPAQDDPYSYNVGDVVAVNTLDGINRHPIHPPGILVYQCVENPDSGTCSIDPDNIDNQQDCLNLDGEWTPTPSPGLSDNIPRTEGTGYDTGDGYKWDYLFTIPRDVESSYVSNDWLIVPTQSEVDEESDRWALTNEVNLGDNRIMQRINAFYVQVTARIQGSTILTITAEQTSYRQISLVNNPLLITNSIQNPVQKATDELVEMDEVIPDSGEFLVIENRSPATRDIDQTEEFRIVIQF